MDHEKCPAVTQANHAGTFLFTSRRAILFSPIRTVCVILNRPNQKRLELAVPASCQSFRSVEQFFDTRSSAPTLHDSGKRKAFSYLFRFGGMKANKVENGVTLTWGAISHESTHEKANVTLAPIPLAI